ILQESLQEVGSTDEKRGKLAQLAAFKGRMKYLYTLSFFVAFSLAGLESTFQVVEIAKIGATVLQVGMMFGVVGIVEAIMHVGVIRLFTTQGGGIRGIVLGLFGSAAGFFLILFSQNVGTATLYLAIFGAGNALIRPCVLSLLTKKTSVGQGITTGLNSSM